MLLELGMKADLASDKVEEELSALSECPSVSTSFLCSREIVRPQLPAKVLSCLSIINH